MEPNDFDRLLKEKLAQPNEAYQKEVEASKPFVWSAIQREVHMPYALKWYHLAAAVILLLITFGFVFTNMKGQHQDEMLALTNKVEELQQYYESQEEVLNAKDMELARLSGELERVESKLVTLNEQAPVSYKETIVYRTDTVIVERVEYIEVAPQPMIAQEVSTPSSEGDIALAVQTNSKEAVEYDQAIYPSGMVANRKSENRRFRLGGATTRSN